MGQVSNELYLADQSFIPVNMPPSTSVMSLQNTIGLESGTPLLDCYLLS